MCISPMYRPQVVFMEYVSPTAVQATVHMAFELKPARLFFAVARLLSRLRMLHSHWPMVAREASVGIERPLLLGGA